MSNVFASEVGERLRQAAGESFQHSAWSAGLGVRWRDGMHTRGPIGRLEPGDGDVRIQEDEAGFEIELLTPAGRDWLAKLWAESNRER